MEQRDQDIAVDLDAVALGLLGERLVDAGLPIDQGAVDVEGDEGDVLWNRHRARHYASHTPRRALRPLRLESRAAYGPTRVPRQAAVRPPRVGGVQRQGRDHRR